MEEQFTKALEADVPPTDLRRHVTVETSRGRRERRAYFAMPASQDFLLRRIVRRWHRPLQELRSVTSTEVLTASWLEPAGVASTAVP